MPVVNASGGGRHLRTAAGRGIAGGGESRSEVVLQLAELLPELGQRGMLGRLLLEQFELPAFCLQVARGLFGSDVDAELDAVETLLDGGREFVCALAHGHCRQQDGRHEGHKSQASTIR